MYYIYQIRCYSGSSYILFSSFSFFAFQNLSFVYIFLYVAIIVDVVVAVYQTGRVLDEARPEIDELGWVAIK